MPYSDERTKKATEALGLQENMKNNDGFTIGTIIFWDDKRSIERQRSTLAHELGHIILGHSKGGQGIVNCAQCQERQADSFAFNLLCPDFMP